MTTLGLAVRCAAAGNGFRFASEAVVCHSDCHSKVTP